jgi:phosphate uptake regulator
MERRKIQLIAGTTYTISLPKDWVVKNSLSEKDELIISEKNNRTLVISHGNPGNDKALDSLSLNVDEYPESIDQILFAAYYLGVENITIYSKTELEKTLRARIRKTITHMSGTEISYEDRQKLTIRVLLDKSKIDLIQVLYRISLLIESSISGIESGPSMEEIRMNENEIDRLYHLTAKIISLALIDSAMLASSNIKNVSLVPSYFLMSKRLENIGDNLNHLAEYLTENKIEYSRKGSCLGFVREELARSISFIMALHRKGGVFPKASAESFRKAKESASAIKDQQVRGYIEEMIRYIGDIEEEITNISFYSRLIKEDVI